jgi:hypothetical protein
MAPGPAWRSQRVSWPLSADAPETRLRVSTTIGEGRFATASAGNAATRACYRFSIKPEDRLGLLVDYGRGSAIGTGGSSDRRVNQRVTRAVERERSDRAIGVAACHRSRSSDYRDLVRARNAPGLESRQRSQVARAVSRVGLRFRKR